MGIVSTISFATEKRHVDNNKHINNGVIIGDYMERGRKDLLEINGLDPNSLRGREISMFVNQHVGYKHHSQILHPSSIEVLSRFGDRVGKLRFLVEQELYACGELAVTGSCEYFFVDIGSEKPKSIRPPKDLVDQIYNLISFKRF
ncbi:MAG: thioesterase family protein [Nanoarchaeota archaeon]|nr:thioesterase family protein [Nanoarchaeota archaeon]